MPKKTALDTPAVKAKPDPVLFSTNLKFLFSFILLFCFAVCNFFVLDSQVGHAERDAACVGFMEKQYGLVQKTTFLSIEYARSADAVERTTLRANVHDDLRSQLVTASAFRRPARM